MVLDQKFSAEKTFYVCNNKATPAKVHLPGLSFVFKLKVQT